MSYFLFVDESGSDQRDSPYEVLAGIAIEDRKLWPLIGAIQDLEVAYFGRRYADGERELKAKKILKRKVFRHAAQADALDPAERVLLARACLDEGAGATARQLAALGQAKIEFVDRVLQICRGHDCKAFASIVVRGAPRSSDNFLRKDYAYLFERFFYFLQTQAAHHQGLVVFDELERTQGHILVDQMAHYFSNSANGRTRSSRVIPEPFFVHSHLTTGVQLADLIAYIAAWGMQVGRMPQAQRPELHELGGRVHDLEFHVRRGGFARHGFCLIEDLRPREHRKTA